jgi:hypothetical protein
LLCTSYALLIALNPLLEQQPTILFPFSSTSGAEKQVALAAAHGLFHLMTF